MKIISIDAGSLGEELGLKPGDMLVSINGKEMRDIIDYQYAVYDEDIVLKVERNGQATEFEIEKDAEEDLGTDFEPFKHKSCGCKCIFCFVDQNPEGLRRALYFRDEDYRLSFLHGSYVTLTTIGKKDLKRIIDQKLSPLYISVHALDPAVRRYMFGISREDYLKEKIEQLVSAGIELHTQIVLCPGINDGIILDDTINGLASYFPGIRSIAIVPLGLTEHREGLEKLSPVTEKYSHALIRKIHREQKNYLDNFRERFVYLADEWYLGSGRKLPPPSHYGEFFQLENGVGMTRQFIRSIKRQKRVFRKPFNTKKKIHILTAELAYPVLREELVPILEQADGLTAGISGIENRFYGKSVTVSGLLSGGDFVRIIRAHDADLFLLPPDCLNHDGLTLDDMTIGDMESRTGKKIVQYDGSLQEIRDRLDAA